MAKREESYFDLLRRPEWQKKRLEVMERARWVCERCGDAGTTLNVHHTYYEKDHAPWEYPTESLHCLCECCHECAQDISTMLKRMIGKLPLCRIEEALGHASLSALVEDELRRKDGRTPPEEPPLRVPVPTRHVAIGLADGLSQWGVTEDEVFALLDQNGRVSWSDIMTFIEKGKRHGR